MDATVSTRVDSRACGQMCPHVERNDPRCASVFTLGTLDETFAMCMGGYRRCPLYHRMRMESERLSLGDGRAWEEASLVGTIAAPPLRLVGDSDGVLQRRPRTDVLTHVTRNGRRILLGATGS